jgi:hypothetical protein
VQMTTWRWAEAVCVFRPADTPHRRGFELTAHAAKYCERTRFRAAPAVRFANAREEIVKEDEVYC